MKFTRVLSLMICIAITPLANAAANSQSDATTAALKQKLRDTINVEVSSINESAIPGLYEALTNRGVLYITKDGSKLIHGNVYDLQNGLRNLTEAVMAGARAKLIKPFEKDMLVYKAKNEKHVVTIFTDIDCGYCRKLHSEMPEYNALGITVRYLAFPRSGFPSKTATEMEAVWCSPDPLKAMDAAKAGKDVDAAKCESSVKAQYYLGQELGVNGTPAIILEDGTMIPGYQPPAQLLRAIESNG